MGRYEASSSPRVAALPIEEDPSLSLRITKTYQIDVILPSEAN